MSSRLWDIGGRFLGARPLGSAATIPAPHRSRCPNEGFFGPFPINSKTAKHGGNGRPFRQPRLDAQQSAIAGRPFSHTLSTARRGQAQLIEQKAIVYFSQSAQLIRISCCLPRKYLKINDRTLKVEDYGIHSEGDAVCKLLILNMVSAEGIESAQ